MPADKIIDPNLAAKAYTSSMNVGGKAGNAAEDDGGVSFSDLLRGSLENTVDKLRKGEEMSAKAVTGEADVNDVVQAVTQAELALQTVVAMRDRLVSAYQDIMRMPI
ncbi:MAG: flagellar hook-basal body complex protein FliE [Rhodospirillales bacterium]|nr:flagellar hook-basal body complex protein FliE [Alphaproteobacteria bacterium]MCB1839253.1 flagellar hook-basal body complex protein FliE [Alphaproteobacteria bacterium]MCB9976184.1 flagellar hook-basal body complex protein FliE [Rhodospirillales bacterium]